MSFKRFNGIPHPSIYAALIPAEAGLGLPSFDLLMPQKEFTVGRAEHNDICIRGAGISDEHCKLVWNTEKKMLFVEWLPTTNGTWIMNERYECHRLKEGESYPLLGGEISFAPSINRYGKASGLNDYMYSVQVYTEHEMADYLAPDQLAERKRARARFRNARCVQDTSKCVITYRSSSDRAPDASLPRQATPPFIPPPRLGNDFRYMGNVGHYQPRYNPDGHDRADPDIVWRGFVPIKPGTKSVVPGEVDLWSHHYGLPVGLHPKYSIYSGVPYDDTPTEIDRERLERRKCLINYIGSAEQKAAHRADCQAEGRTYFSPTPSPSPVPDSPSAPSPHLDELQPTLPSPDTGLPLLDASPPHTRTPDGLLSEHAPDRLGSPTSVLGDPSTVPLKDGNTADSKRKRDADLTGDERPAKRRSSHALSGGPRTRTRSARSRSPETKKVGRKTRNLRAADSGAVHDTSPRRSARLVGKPAVRYKY